MSAVKRLNQTRQFSWIGSDGWSARNLVSEGNEEVVEGTISVQPLANPVEGFDEYFFNRSLQDKVNPYFAGTIFQLTFSGWNNSESINDKVMSFPGMNVLSNRVL